MEYQVPQFIEVEDKIIGPLTLRQFIYIAGAAGLCILFFYFLPLILAFLFALPVVAFAGSLAFYKVNGKPFVEILEAGFAYFTRSKLFLWKHQDMKAPKSSVVAATESTLRGTPKLTRGKLSELAWSLDVKPSGGDVANREK